MELLLARVDCTADRTIGQLFVGPSFECFTLEPPLAHLAVGDAHPAIPVGRYPVTLRPSAHFGRLVPHIDDVPGRFAIEIHEGNTVHDTHGCVVVGQSTLHDSVLSSQIALGALQPQIARALADGDAVWIDVLDPVPEP